MYNINTNYNKGWDEYPSSRTGIIPALLLLGSLIIFWIGECVFSVKRRLSKGQSSQGIQTEPSTQKESTDYSSNDLALIEKMGWHCERCKHEHEPNTEYTLGAYPLDGDDSNKVAYNWACLCQVCWAAVQGIKFELQSYETAGVWFKPHLDGYYDYIYRNEL